MRLGTWKLADENTILTREGTTVESLFYVLSGGIEVRKKERTFALQPHTFIGEVAFLLDRPASATVTLNRGARFIEWSAAPLSRLLVRRPLLKDAMGARFNADLAMKVSSA
jgi:CRP-like cAMP-binding protein